MRYISNQTTLFNHQRQTKLCNRSGGRELISWWLRFRSLSVASSLDWLWEVSDAAVDDKDSTMSDHSASAAQHVVQLQYKKWDVTWSSSSLMSIGQSKSRSRMAATTREKTSQKKRREKNWMQKRIGTATTSIAIWYVVNAALCGVWRARAWKREHGKLKVVRKALVSAPIEVRHVKQIATNSNEPLKGELWASARRVLLSPAAIGR